jgi:hypothetical protein
MRIRFSRFFTACVLMAGAVGCGGDHCTEIGCTNGLLIDVKKPIAIDESVHVKIEMGDDVRECDLSTTSSKECDDAGITPQRDGDRWVEIDLIDVVATDARVTITVGDAETTQDFSPDYVESSPNGDGCPPYCKIAVVEF